MQLIPLGEWCSRALGRTFGRAACGGSLSLPWLLLAVMSQKRRCAARPGLPSGRPTGPFVGARDPLCAVVPPVVLARLPPGGEQEGEGPQRVLTGHGAADTYYRDDAAEPALMPIMFAQLGDDEKAEFFVRYDTQWT